MLYKNRLIVFFVIYSWCTPKFLNRFKSEYKMKTMEKSGLGARSLVRNTFGGKGVCWSSGMGLGRVISNLFIHTNLQKLNNKLVSALLEHFWC
jgi:hypothetical protein